MHDSTLMVPETNSTSSSSLQEFALRPSIPQTFTECPVRHWWHKIVWRCLELLLQRHLARLVQALQSTWGNKWSQLKVVSRVRGEAQASHLVESLSGRWLQGWKTMLLLWAAGCPQPSAELWKVAPSKSTGKGSSLRIRLLIVEITYFLPHRDVQKIRIHKNYLWPEWDVYHLDHGSKASGHLSLLSSGSARSHRQFYVPEAAENQCVSLRAALAFSSMCLCSGGVCSLDMSCRWKNWIQQEAICTSS